MGFILMLGRVTSATEVTGGRKGAGELGDSTAMLPQSSGFLPATKLEYFGLILISFFPESMVGCLSVAGNIVRVGRGFTREGLVALTPVGVGGGVRVQF